MAMVLEKAFVVLLEESRGKKGRGVGMEFTGEIADADLAGIADARAASARAVGEVASGVGDRAGPQVGG